MLFVSLAAHAFTYNHQDGNLCYMLIDSYCYVCGVADGVTGKVVVPESIRHKSSVDHKTRTYKVVAVAKDGFSGNSQQGLEELVLPETITEIYSGAFNGCGALKTVNIPSQVTELDNVLNNCPSLTKITIPATVSKLNQILNNSTIEEFIIADSETDLPANGLFSSNSVIKKFYQGRNCTGVSFSNKGIESLVLGDNITEIHSSMYEKNPLQEVTFGKNITKIDSYAFYNTKLKEVTLPESLIELGSWSFDNCDLLESFYISSKISEIKDNFNRCVALSKVIIPANVILIEKCFHNCGTIDEFIIADGDTPLKISDLNYNYGSWYKNFYQGRNFVNTLLQDKGIETLTIGDRVTEIGGGMYQDNPLKVVTFGKNLEKIGSYAFYNTKLKEVNLPESLTELGYSSFCKCDLLESLEISSKLTTIDNNFNDCPALSQITIPANISLIEKSFHNCGTIDEFIIADGDTALQISDLNYNYGSWYKNFYQGRNFVNTLLQDKGIETLTIGDRVTEIGGGMYQDNPLKVVTFGKNLEKIGSYAFYNTKLKEVNLPESLTELGYSSFCKCDLLESLEISSKLTTIDNNFNDCPALSQITIPANISLIEKSFHNCGTIDEFIIADGDTALQISDLNYNYGSWYKNFYQGRNFINTLLQDKGIESLTIGDQVTEISSSMYEKNPLQQVTFGKNLVKIGGNAFWSCDNIEQITVFAENVPVCENNSVFTQNAYDNAKVLVPSGSRKAYAEAPVWKLFKNLGQSTCAVSFEYNAKECALTLPEGFEGSVKNGENLTFNVQPLDGFRIGKVTAEGNCKALVAGENSTWTLDSITSDITVKIPSEIITYAVKANIDPKTGQITINGEATDSLRVEWGKSAIVDVELYEGYKLDSVKVNGADATLTDSKLMFGTVYEDKTVEIAASLMTYLFTTEFDSECGTVTVGGNTATEQTYTYGSRPEIEVIPNIGYCPSYVRLNGEDIMDRMTDNKFTVDSIKSNMTLNVGFEVRTVMLSVLGLEGGRVATVYDYGETARVKIIPDEDWRINSIIFNGTPIDENELENGLFVTPALTDDSEISVTFEKDNSSVNKVEAGNDIRVYGNNRTIRIENAPEGEPCHIFDVDGRTIYSGTEHIIKMNAGGIYIVAINDRSFKLMLK